jgi:hypothetical protein
MKRVAALLLLVVLAMCGAETPVFATVSLPDKGVWDGDESDSVEPRAASHEAFAHSALTHAGLVVVALVARAAVDVPRSPDVVAPAVGTRAPPVA